MNTKKLIEEIEALKRKNSFNFQYSVKMYNDALDAAIDLIRKHEQPVSGVVDEIVTTKNDKAFALREWTDDEGRLWKLLDFGYGTPSDIRLSLRLGVAFHTATYTIQAKQPTPADETLSKNIKNINADLEQWDNVIAPNYKSPNSDVDIGELYYYASKFREALSQPPKTAMSREELVQILENAAYDDIEGEVGGLLDPDMAINALEAAGVLNVKG